VRSRRLSCRSFPILDERKRRSTHSKACHVPCDATPPRSCPCVLVSCRLSSFLSLSATPVSLHDWRLCLKTRHGQPAVVSALYRMSHVFLPMGMRIKDESRTAEKRRAGPYPHCYCCRIVSLPRHRRSTIGNVSSRQQEKCMYSMYNYDAGTCKLYCRYHAIGTGAVLRYS
jgi:hypothetical protein